VENGALIKFMLSNYIQDSSGAFSIIILTSEDIDNIISCFHSVACAKILMSI